MLRHDHPGEVTFINMTNQEEAQRVANAVSMYKPSLHVVPLNLDDLTVSDFKIIFLTDDLHQAQRLKKLYNYAREQKEPFTKYLATNEVLAWSRGIVNHPAIKKISFNLN
jgi:hypothetical protein